MSSWLGSLDSVVRLQNIALWLTVFGALTAAFSGVAGYYLSNRAAALRARLGASEIEAVQQEARRELDARMVELRESRRLLEASEARAGELSERVSALEENLAQRPSSARESAPGRPKSAAGGSSASAATSPEQRLTRSLAGRPSGAITLVAVAGQSDSLSLARRLASALRKAGWTTEVIEATFPSPPEELIFVVHGRGDIPERQHGLALALADAGLLTLPAKMTANPTRPAGFLGLLVGAPNR